MGREAAVGGFVLVFSYSSAFTYIFWKYVVPSVLETVFYRIFGKGSECWHFGLYYHPTHRKLEEFHVGTT